MESMKIKQPRAKKIVYCPKCKLHHSGKVCPVLTGKLDSRWTAWAKLYAQANWIQGRNHI